MDDLVQSVDLEAERDAAVLVPLQLLRVMPRRFLDDLSGVRIKSEFNVVRSIAPIDGPGVAEVVS